MTSSNRLSGNLHADRSRGARDTRPRLTGRSRRAFTMTELLVVIGIIILVVGIAMPSITTAWKKADRARTAGDLQAIATALEAYKQDHGGYPLVETMNTGGAVLGKALCGPGQATTVAPVFSGSVDYAAGDLVAQGTAEYYAFNDPPRGAAPTDVNYWAPFKSLDGFDGPGFRVRAGGKPSPAYLAIDRFAGSGSTGRFQMGLRDRYNKAILYYPATGSPNIHVDRGYVANFDPAAPRNAGTRIPLYNVRDNLRVLTEQKLRLALGDRNNNGMIDAGETAAHTGGYILWSAGPDEQYGPTPDLAPDRGTLDEKDVPRMDDVTNFR